MNDSTINSLTSSAMLGGTDGLRYDDLLVVAEVASAMRVSKMSVYRMIHAGELPAIRVGRTFRVPRRAVADYLAAGAVVPTQPTRFPQAASASAPAEPGVPP